MRPEDLPGDALRILDALTRARVAWQAVAELARAAGLAPDVAADLLADLDLAGWIQPWPEPPVGPYPWAAPVVTLTPLGAARLGVHLADFGTEEVPRWVKDGEDDPPPPKAKGIFRKYESLALIADPTPGPVELAIAAEEAPPEEPRARRRRREEKPYGAWHEAQAAARAQIARDRRKARRRAGLARLKS